MSERYHIPVLLEETLDLLDARKGGLFLDCTLGGGGHSEAILCSGGSVVAIDRDLEAVAWSSKRLAKFGKRFIAHEARFSRIREVADVMTGRFDGVLMDLGLSSHMIDDSSRGFSYRQDGPLLMDMGGAAVDAGKAVNGLDRRELADIFRTLGEERHAARIADAIVRARSLKPVETTGELARIVEEAVGGPMPHKSKARVFQALRMHVNDEIGELRTGLAGAVEVMRPGGRLCVISYHSLEDREVKTFFRDRAVPCVCPPGFPECRCGRTPDLKIITRKPVGPTPREAMENERSRSARLRAAEKLGAS